MCFGPSTLGAKPRLKIQNKQVYATLYLQALLADIQLAVGMSTSSLTSLPPFFSKWRKTLDVRLFSEGPMASTDGLESSIRSSTPISTPISTI